MAKIDITIPGERIVETFTALVPQPTAPSTAKAPDVGLVELSHVNPTVLVPGPPGPPGPAGSRWYTGVGPPSSTGGTLGDMYLDDSTGKIYTWNGSSWVDTGTDLSPDASELLLKIKTVDGAGSGLDADTLDGMDSTEFATDAELAAIATSANNRVLKAGDTMTGTLVIPLGTQALPSLAFASDPNTGIYSLNADQVGITTGGSVRLWVTTGTVSTIVPITVQATAAIPAGGATTMGLKFSSTANYGVFAGSGAPTLSAAKGSIYLRSDGVSNTRTYVNTDGTTGWTPLLDTSAPFPEAPIDGTTYGRKDAAWTTVVGGAIISDTPPSSPQVGQMWFESDSGNTFIWYSDGDSSQWVQVNIQPAIATNPTAGMTAQTRNRLVNPAMQVSQELGYTASATNNSFPADQWPVTFTSSAATFDIRRLQIATPNGSRDRIRIVPTVADTSLAAGEYCAFNQVIEGIRIADFRWGTASAKQVVLRFGFTAPAGTYGVSIVNAPTTHSYVATFTITAGQANVDTEQVLVIPGATVGVWATDNTPGLLVRISVAAGSTYQGTANVWQAGGFFGTAACSNGLAVANAIFLLYDVGLYLDPLNTGLPPQWEMPDEAAEMLACRRYYYRRVFDLNEYICNLQAYQTNNLNGKVLEFPVSMRIAPASTVSAMAHFGAQTAGPGGSPISTMFLYTVPSAAWAAPMTTVNAVLAPGNCSSINSNTPGAHMTFNARM